MGDYDQALSRTNAGALISEEVSKQIWKELPKSSFCLDLMRKLPPMSKKQYRMPVLSALPSAYWVDGEAGAGAQGYETYQEGLLKTSKMAWQNKYVYAEKLGIICPVPGDVLDDADFDVLAEYVPEIAASIGRALDSVVLFGTSAPANFPDDILTKATAAGNVVELGTGTDMYDDIWSENGILQAVRSDGYRPNAIVGGLTLEGRLDGLRDSLGNPVIVANPGGSEGNYVIKGIKVTVPDNGAMDETQALAIAGDWKQAVYSYRKEIKFTKSTEASIHDNSGNLVYNSFQQDMVLLKATIRWGWQMPNPINTVQSVEANRSPFAVLTPASE